MSNIISGDDICRKFTLLIMTRDRPEELKECINSTKGLLGPVIVSDNSIQDYEYNFPAYVKHIRRSGVMSGIDHINTCLSEVETPFFCIFHDDDIFLADEFFEFINYCIRHDEYAAFATNSIQLVHGQLNNRPTCNFNSSMLSEDDIRHAYLSPFSKGIPPLPGYIYNKKKIGAQHFCKSKGGKFCDASFILDTARSGPIFFWAKPTIVTRLHDGNDQNTYRVSDYKCMYSYLKPPKHHGKLSFLVLYRISRFFKLRGKKSMPFLLRLKVVMSYGFYLACRLYTKMAQ